MKILENEIENFSSFKSIREELKKETCKYQFIQGKIDIGEMNDNKDDIYIGVVIDKNKRGNKSLNKELNGDHNSIVTKLRTSNMKEVKNWLEFVNNTYFSNN